MNTIIFLDVDGVLNTDYTTEECCGFIGIEDNKVSLLAKLVDNFNAKVVLSSTWREEWDSKIGEYLREKLDKYGITISAMTPMIHHRKRCIEIEEWLESNNVDRIIILDDEDFSWSNYKLEKYWVETSPYKGLTMDIVDDIINNKERFNYEIKE